MGYRAYPHTGYGLGSMSRILLVRHGESEWNALGRWQGQADPPLSEHGRRQASHAAERLGAVDLIVSSTLQRARTTASIISEILGVGPVVTDDRLIERDAGEWSGLTRAQIAAEWPGYLADDPKDRAIERRPPGWESDASLLERARAALVDIAARVTPDGSALAVTHGGIIYALEAALDAPRRYLPNVGARWVALDAGEVTLGDRIHLYDPDADPGQGDATPVDSEAV